MTKMNDVGIELRFGIPPFRLVLPPGWVQRAPTNVGLSADLKKASELFARAGRPDLDVEFRTLMAKASVGLQRTKVFAIYRQEDVPPEEMLPLSITASVVNAERGRNLDSWVGEAFRSHGAVFLDEELRHIVRWSSAVATPEGAERLPGVGGRAITYVIPAPGTMRRTALVFNSTIVIPDGDVIPAEVVEGVEALSDLMISTFTWERSIEEEVVAE